MSQVSRRAHSGPAQSRHTLTPLESDGDGRKRTGNSRRRIETEDDEHVYLVHEGRATHVVMPVEVYERLVKSEMALHTIAATDNRNDDDWIDAQDFGIELARDAVVQARKAAGLTQTQLAKKLGVPQSQISRIERNPDRTTVRTLKRIAKALRVDVSALI